MNNKEEYIINTAKLIHTNYRFISVDVAITIACQSALETNYGKSNIYKENHNLFGMKKATIRINTQIGIHREHAVYLDHLQSINDYLFWCTYNKMTQQDFRTITDFENSFKFEKYCPNKDYKKRIIEIRDNFYKNLPKNNQN